MECPDIKDADGILNIDIGIFFDYSNQGIVTLGFGLITDDIKKDEDTEDDVRYLFADTVLNHRYNHKGYITISRRSGKKVSKTGYPIAGPIEELNRYKMLMVMCGIKDKTITVCFPINISLTKDDPIGGIELIIHDWELNSADKWGIDMFALFQMEENFGLKVLKKDGSYYLQFRDENLNKHLEKWYEKQKELEEALHSLTDEECKKECLSYNMFEWNYTGKTL